MTFQIPLSLCVSLGLLSFANPVTSQTECPTEDLCDGQFLSAINENIECSGYSSCSQSSQDTNQESICSGSFSCFEASPIITGSATTCSGFASCADSTISSNNSILCLGGASCQESNLTFFGGTSHQLDCSGTSSCEGSFISASNVIVDGMFGAYDAFITDQGFLLSVIFNGYLSGNNALIECKSGSYCYIECHGSGCIGLEINCLDNAICDVNCDDSESCSICPYGYNPEYSWDIFDYDGFNDIENAGNVMQECEDLSITESSVRCMDKLSCADQEVGPGTNNEPICCGGDESCAEAINIINSNDILCGGSESCEFANYIESSNINQGRILCVGNNGCGNSNISDAFRVFCGANQACAKSDFSDISEIYCGGKESCLESTISNTNGSIFALGGYALSNSIISNISGDLTCNGASSCSEITMESAENIFASGYQSLYQSTVRYINNNLYCIGEESCKGSSLNGMRELVAYGPSALEGANIYGLEGDSLFIQAGGDNSPSEEETYEETFIHCNSTTSCIISCQSPNACNKMIVFCNGECNYICNEVEDPFDVFISCPLEFDVSNGKGGSNNKCDNKNNNGGSDGGLIALIVILVILVLVLIFLYITERNKNKTEPKISLKASSDDAGQAGITLNASTGKKDFETFDD